MLNRTKYVLDGAYINRAFQMSVQLVVKNTIYGTVKYNSTVIYNWTKNKFANMQMPESIRNFEKSRMGYDVSIIYKPENTYFCLKASHPDAVIPGRIWTIGAEIIVINENVLFGVKLSYSTPINSNVGNAVFSMPSFVGQIAKQNGILDVRRLGCEVWDIEVEREIEQLYDFIQNPNRKVPVIVVTEKESNDDIGAQYTKGYLVDADLLAKEMASIAHTVRISRNIINEWNAVVGKKWGVYGGAVRTYFPDVDFGEEDYMRHPLSIANRIMASSYTDEDGEEHIAGEAFRYLLGKI